jgi:hypothetical protein
MAFHMVSDTCIVLTLCFMSLRTTIGGDTCDTMNGGICSEAISEADASEADDVHASVSLLQKEMAHMQRSSHNSKLAKIQSQDADAGRFPFDYVQCPGEMAMQTIQMTGADYDAVVMRMRQIYDSQNSTCAPEDCAQSHWAGCVLRMAAHDFMDFSAETQTGGADGCIDLSDDDNRGLARCLIGGPAVVGLVEVYEDFCTKISLADFFIIAAEGVMNITRAGVLDLDSTRQPVDFRSRFRYGRTTLQECSSSLGLLPDAGRGCGAVDDTLIKNLGLNWGLAAALLGGHTLGGALTSNTGYYGRWTEANRSRLFDNGYYTSLLLKGWVPDLSIAGNSAKNQWKRADVGVDTKNNGYEMMLDSDMCLYFNFYLHKSNASEFHAGTARSQGCECAWARPSMYFDAVEKYTNGVACGSSTIFDLGSPAPFTNTGDITDPSSEVVEDATFVLNLTQEANANSVKQRMLCCGASAGTASSGDAEFIVDAAADCGEPGRPRGPAAVWIGEFANNEPAWIQAYYTAWSMVTMKGHEGSLFPLSG